MIGVIGGEANVGNDLRKGFRVYGVRLIELLGSSCSPVMARLPAGEDLPVGSQAPERQRYIQALRSARRGQSMTLNNAVIACPGVAA